jgi:hypothetical protein
MTAPRQKKDGKGWLIGLAIGVLVALIGPTWLYNRHFNPTEDVIFRTSSPEASATPSPSPPHSADSQR